LAQQLETHELLEFRRISAYLNKLNKRFKPSIELSKKDGLWKDAIETTAESKDQDLAESIVRFFVDEKRYECFAACLYVCYELIRPDVVMELTWRHQLTNYAMPYQIQTLREYDIKMGQIYAKFAAHDKEKEEEKEKEKEKAQTDVGVTPGFGAGGAILSLMPPPGMMPGLGGYPAYPPPGGGGFFG